MNLEDFKDVHKDDSPIKKLRLLVDAVETVERCRHGTGDEDYLAREREGQKDRANWLYEEVMKALETQEPRVTCNVCEYSRCLNGEWFCFKINSNRYGKRVTDGDWYCKDAERR